MEDNNNILANNKSYNFDNFNNIIVENVDDLLYDKFFFNNEQRNNLDRIDISLINRKINNNFINHNSKKQKKKLNHKTYNLINNFYISKEIDNKRYKDFIKRNKDILLYFKNRNKNDSEKISKNNSFKIFKKPIIRISQNKIKMKELEIENFSNEFFKNENNEEELFKHFKKINQTSLNKNNNFMNGRYYSSTNFHYFQENSKSNYKSKDRKENKKNYFLINNFNFYNYSEKSAKFKNKLKNSNKLIKENQKFLKFHKLSSKIPNECFSFDEQNILEDRIKYNLISFSYPKIEANKINYNTNYHFAEKHFSNEANCPVCQSLLKKKILNEKLMGLFKEDENIKINSFLRKKMYKNKFLCGKLNKINYIFPNSKIQQYKKQLSFYNATKGIKKSKSDDEFKYLDRAKKNKNKYINKRNKTKFLGYSPVILYYFK